MSLSWGSSYLAVEQALATDATRFAIIGCGVMGLSTARLLQKHGMDVTIYSKDIPPNTTSNMSAAWWSPGSTVDPSERTEAYDKQFVRAAASPIATIRTLSVWNTASVGARDTTSPKTRPSPAGAT